ncbi:unnamed protein product [Rhizoctonia solani]|uniref:F-box domain-containing protein n=1 Tax=Rhizoctonia solani AG-3 Rhs1AP TaxID=1086054 RepID=A0A0A1UL77_9AGAM|nr:hypothetical protein RSOL_321090 [Rhizoctonia solani AG-3 Rhs1AP]CAE6397249.1 unnamed protein product [Rhizoctonia solani]
MSKRSSARLAKLKSNLVNRNTDAIQDVPESDASDGYADSEQEEQKPPPRKRQRTAKPAKPVVRQKQVRGKQGRLAGLVNMPVDIFTEVTSHLLPGDIISLARSNKFFRNLLMDRSAIHIWHGAMKNVEGLPPCPEGMSEPHYLSLLFSKTCSMCGATARVNMDSFLLVRLCGPCRNKHLMPLSAVPPALIPLIQFGESIAPSKRRCRLYVLREDFKVLLADYEEKKQSNDNSALEVWTKERLEIVNEQQNQGSVLLQFLETMQWDREQELIDMKAARRSEIKRRLLAIGWTEEDMEFGWWSSRAREWIELVLQPKPVTNRIWANLQLKLIPLLETNREERLAMECENRKRDRRSRLSELFLEIKKNNSPDLVLKATNPITRLSSMIPTITFAHREPFPDFPHTLDWPLVQNLYETDSSVTEMETKFEENRNEIENLVTEWKDRIQAHFVNLLRDGCNNQVELLRPAIVTCNDDFDSPTNISDDLKIILRADSFFYQTWSSDLPKRSLSYGTILYIEGLNGSHSGYVPALPRPAPSLDNVYWYAEAHEAARHLLADMGKPDATYLEMKSVGNVFACGRCHEDHHRNWDEMVQHYVDHKELHAEIQAGKGSSDAGITYNDVHSPTLPTDQPMIMDYATKALENGPEPGLGYLQVCKLCEKIPAVGEVLASEPVILKHLLNVHGITEPEVDEHYGPKPFTVGSFGMDGYDSDDSYSDYYFGGGCSCPFHQMFGDDGYGYGDDDSDDDDW